MGESMVTIRELAEDWIQGRSALKRQLKLLEEDSVFPQSGLSEDARKAISLRLKIAISEFDGLLKEYPNA
jgi:hypothetical protein